MAKNDPFPGPLKTGLERGKKGVPQKSRKNDKIIYIIIRIIKVYKRSLKKGTKKMWEKYRFQEMPKCQKNDRTQERMSRRDARLHS